ncbi:hypothetical protein BDW72DRAFT_187672 [Aspergillus terricola var. indicus]
MGICMGGTDVKSRGLSRSRVIMINRKKEQGESAIKRIKDEFGGKAQIEWLPCDLENLKQVNDVFGGIRERKSRLDLLILAAGISANAYGESANGIGRILRLTSSATFMPST